MFTPTKFYVHKNMQESYLYVISVDKLDDYAIDLTVRYWNYKEKYFLGDDDQITIRRCDFDDWRFALT